MSKDAYKSTLCLPQTSFPMKADLPKAAASWNGRATAC